MLSSPRKSLVASALLAICVAAPAAAVPVAPGYVVDSIPTPDTATGGVVAVGGTLFVGVGSFGAGTESVVRIDPGGAATTIATGFNSLSGFVYDAVNDRLIVGDNALEVGGTTGDTVYSIPDPFGTPVTAPVADTLELLPAGSIQGAADVILDPNDATNQTLLVSDAFFPFPGPPDGKLWSVDALGGTATQLQGGLGFAAGLAASGGTLFLGDVDATFFTGLIHTVSLADLDGPRGVLVGGLAGQTDLVLASDGFLLATAVGDVLRIDPATGTPISIASGFEFATGIAEENGIFYVIEGGFTSAGPQVLRFTPIPEPGSWALLALGCAALGARARRGR